MEAPNGAQAGPGKTQRDKIFEAVEALRLLLGQGVCSQVEDLIQEHFSRSQRLLLPIPRLNSSVLSNLPICLKKKPDLRRIFEEWRTGLASKVGGVSGR